MQTKLRVVLIRCLVTLFTIVGVMSAVDFAGTFFRKAGNNEPVKLTEMSKVEATDPRSLLDAALRSSLTFGTSSRGGGVLVEDFGFSGLPVSRNELDEQRPVNCVMLWLINCKATHAVASGSGASRTLYLLGLNEAAGVWTAWVDRSLIADVHYIEAP